MSWVLRMSFRFGCLSFIFLEVLQISAPFRDKNKRVFAPSFGGYPELGGPSCLLFSDLPVLLAWSGNDRSEKKAQDRLRILTAAGPVGLSVRCCSVFSTHSSVPVVADDLHCSRTTA